MFMYSSHMEDTKKPLHEEIMALMLERAKVGNNINEYINPNFLCEIVNSLYVYYELENDEVDEWISNMWGA